MHNDTITPKTSSAHRHLTATWTALYREFDHKNSLLYIGASADPEGRRMAHSSSSPWFELADKSRRTIEWHTSRPSALIAESAAVRSEMPLFNVEYYDDRIAAKNRILAYLSRIGRIDLMPVIYRDVAPLDLLSSREWIHQSDAAKILDVPLRSVRQMIRNGLLTGVMRSGLKVMVVTTSSVLSRYKNEL